MKKNGENLLKATNDDVLKSSEQGELRDKDTGSTDVVVPTGTSVTVQASMENWIIPLVTWVLEIIVL